ncbi:hypothetical protein GCM10009633_11100 [Janibacter melonis]
MLNLFPNMKYQPWYALGELVDNAIQSYIANRDSLRDAEGADYRLRIEIEVDRVSDTITVRDNAAGIASADWQRAFRVADPPSDNSGLSQFGVGMKAACCWFAKRWSVRSSALGETEGRAVVFDVPMIVETRDETLEVITESHAASVHFTEVRMEMLYRKPQTRTISKIHAYLGGIYRQFLRNGDVVITFNGDAIEYVEPAVLTAPLWSDPEGEMHTWRHEVNLRLDSGRRVLGFVGIREKGATASAGLALFYRNKVVTGAGEETYRPREIFGASNDFRSQRLFGELHMDDFNVTYTKDALVWYDEEDDFLEALRAELEGGPWPVLRQAKEYRSRRVEKTPQKTASDLLESVASSFAASRGPEQDQTEPPLPTSIEVEFPKVDALPDQPFTDEVVSANRSMTIQRHGTTWHVDFELTADEANSNWLDVREDMSDPRAIQLKVNQAHPFMRAYCELPGTELEPVYRVAIALGIGQALARQGGATMPSLVVHATNELLRTYLSRKAV